MKILDVVQGSDQWLKIRKDFRCGSEAAIMMGAGEISRDDLLQAKSTGIDVDFSGYLEEVIFPNGHRVEELARPFAEEVLGDLYPAVVAAMQVEVVPGVLIDLLSSLDGMVMEQDTLWEHKQWSETLAEQVRNYELGPKHYWQLEQALYITKAEKVVFTVSDGTDENTVDMEYFPVPGRAEELLRGWAQFEADLVDYQPIVVEPKPEGVAIQKLPALVVDVTGKVTSSNLVLYEESAANFVAKINTDLQDDQDFADAKGMVKFCQQVEDELKLVKAQALSQMATVDEVFGVIDRVQEDFRKKRLKLDALVKTREKAIKAEIVGEGTVALWDHVVNLDYKEQILEAINDDFPGAAKNKRTLKSLRESVNDELARCKQEVARLSGIVSSNVAALTGLSMQQRMLFQDVNRLILKDPEDFALLVKSRVDEFEAEEKEKERVADEERKQKLQERFDRIGNAVTTAVTADLEVTEKILAKLKETDPTDFGDRSEEAAKSLTGAIEAVTLLVEDERIAEAERIRQVAEDAKTVEIVDIPVMSFGTAAEKEVEEEAPERVVADKERGLYDKFIVHRTDGRDVPGERHVDCEYFVLDLTHDRHAKAAIRAYSISCGEEFPQLSRDLLARMEEILA